MAGDQHSGETFVAIDIGKAFHAVLVELPDGANQRFRMANSAEDYARLRGIDPLGRACSW